MSKEKSAIKVERTFPQFSDEAFKKIQKLQSTVAGNLEVAQAYQGSIMVHSIAIERLKPEKEVAQLVDVLEATSSTQTKTRDSLLEYNKNANVVIEQLKNLEDEKTIKLVEDLFKLLDF